MQRKSFLIGIALLTALAFPGLTSAQLLDPESFSDSYINGQELRPLTGPDLEAAFNDKMHFGTYKERRERTGTNQFKEFTRADGTTRYIEGDMKLSGRWKVFDDTICYQYEGDEVPGVHCFVIYEAGTCLYGYNPSFAGPKGPINANYWTVKSIREGDISTCDDLIG